MSGQRWIWHELAARNIERSKAFYGEAFGWRAATSHANSDEFNAYWMWSRSDDWSICGGLHQISEIGLRDDPHSRWLPYLSVDDVNEVANRAEALSGGVIAAPLDIPGVGRTAVLADINDAPFAVLKPEKSNEITENSAGCWGWHTVATDDVRLAAAFYKGLFGWDCDTSDDDDLQLTFTLDGAPIAGAFCPQDALVELIPQWICHVAVADVSAATDRLLGMGGEAMEHDMPGAPATTIVIDPDGAGFAVRAAG